jgi:hypothetical protein
MARPPENMKIGDACKDTFGKKTRIAKDMAAM